ncbi:MAG: efflux RND transporter periplasmic adaptor subunit [Puniceicoccales bacterium]|jgi:multidrug efflux system membrane fusion protein|nr:efflux RND transporter periplasmic adaptor subunit [Puniceicoccales bacterium]
MIQRIIFATIALTILGLGALAWYIPKQRSAAQEAARQEATERKKRPVPVVLARAVRQDVPIWLENTGTVQAYNSVTVRPRVSGTLDSVNFSEGQLVDKDDVLAQIDPRPYRAVLAQAQARKVQDEAQLAHARRELERISALVKLDAESQRLLDQQQASVTQLSALVQADQAAMEAAQLDLEFTTLRAPIAGRTGFRQLDAGNTVTANQSTGLVVITQLQPINVVFSMPQKHLAALRPIISPGGKPLPAQAVIDETGEVVGAGELSLLDNSVDVSTDNVRLKATFPNEDAVLWPGQYVLARVLVSTLKGAILVPAEAVKPGVDGPIVYVVRPGNTVEMRSVVLGPEVRQGNQVVIETGISDGEVLVREGQNKLKTGSSIEAARDMSGTAVPAAEKI